MSHGRFITLMDPGRFDLAFRWGLLRPLVKNRWVPVVASVAIRYRRPLHLGERYELATRVGGFDDKFWFIEQRFEADHGLCALAYVKAVFRSRSGNVAPRAMLSAVGWPDGSSSFPLH